MLKLVRRYGSPTWYIRGTVAGQRVQESTGLADRGQAEALRARREWEMSQTAVFGQRASATFLTAAVGYLEDGGETRFVDRLLDHFRHDQLKDIDQGAIDRAAAALYPGRSPATLNRQVYGPMAAILRHAAARGMTDLRAIARPRQQRTGYRWLSQDEARALLAACSPHMKPLVAFLLYTGARVSEALTLEWRHVSIDRAHVTLVDTKNGTDRGVPLHQVALGALVALHGRRTRPLVDHERVFMTHKGQPYAIEKGDDHGGQIKTAFRAALRRAGVAHCRPHDLRHTWATWHYAANRDLKALMTLGGWRDEASVHRYTHVNVAHLAPSVARMPSVGEIWETGSPTPSK